MKKRYTYFVSICLMITVFFVFNVSGIFAQAVNLSISPPLIELLIKPGKSVLIAYNVENHGDPQVLISGVTSFKPVGITGQVQLEPELSGPVRFSLDNSDIELGKGVFLNSDDKQQFLLKIRIPPNAENGDYYYTFFVKTDTGAMLSGRNQSKSTATVGANILITVTDSGQTESSGMISKFKIISNGMFHFLNKKLLLFDSQDPIALQLVVHNKGANLIKPIGVINLKGNFGERTKYNLTPVNIIAQSDRIVPASPSGILTCDENQALCGVPLSLVLRGFFVGKYRLSTDLNFGPGTGNVYGTITFYALPLKLLFMLGITVIVSIVIIRHIKQKENEELFEE